MAKIAIFYHCLFFIGEPPTRLENAVPVIRSQMKMIQNTGLEQAASEIVIGINGGEESKSIAMQELPRSSNLVFHGLNSRSENLTIVELEKWLPDHQEWYVLYLHAKGSTHKTYFSDDWRECMMRHLVRDWKQCVIDLDRGYESVGCHWMEPPQTAGNQHIWAGTFFWAKASFLVTLPSIEAECRRQKRDVRSLDSRYESEVWIGSGPRLPIIRDYHGPRWNPSFVNTCA